ncbi:Glycerol-1-phosphate dehydrogenase [NAD(P)+] [Rickettsiales bacterium Ac37b]|nr:Glycerol-1-phosphate dehydrogenase [NAD(P)+] [Rickettsiales bacterium Ac37b]
MHECVQKAFNVIDGFLSGFKGSRNDELSLYKIYIKQNLLNEIGDILLELPYLGEKIVVVSDENTYNVAAYRICKALSIKKITSVILPANVKPTMDVVHKLQKRIQGMHSLIGVGSGTINDLCKYICYLEKKPYILFATAPSMNGYCSANVSIIVDGYKQSLIATLPTVIMCDLDILSKAPLRLIQSGIGDSLCRSTCQADWLMSHLLFNTTYSKIPFEWIQGLELILWDNIEEVINGSVELIQILMLILILSGIGMYMAKGSYPASQGEHLIAHLLELKYPHNYHGEQIAVTTIFMAELQEYLLNKDKITIYPDNIHETDIKKRFGKKLGKKYFAEINDKFLSSVQAEKVQSNIKMKWYDIKDTIRKNYICSIRLKKILSNAKMADNYKTIGWKYNDYTDAILYSAFIRNRITFLDLARYSRCLEEFVRKIL